MRLNKQDILNHRGLKHILDCSKVELKGDAILRVASLIQWFDDLGVRMNEELKEKANEHISKGEIKPIKKKGK
jgi:hypothetical protein